MLILNDLMLATIRIAFFVPLYFSDLPSQFDNIYVCLFHPLYCELRMYQILWKTSQTKSPFYYIFAKYQDS